MLKFWISDTGRCLEAQKCSAKDTAMQCSPPVLPQQTSPENVSSQPTPFGTSTDQSLKSKIPSAITARMQSREHAMFMPLS